jgi:glucosyl-dolichyl phosphate glucuronosyltransferase
MTPALSVVVATHDRPRDLDRCLAALGRLEDAALVEVIVVDSASTPPCSELVERHARSLPHLRYLREERPGLSRARNRGAAAASAPLVAFVDDDARPRPDWARRVVAPFSADARIGCVGGRCDADFGDLARPAWLSDRLLQFAGITRFGGGPREARGSSEWPFGANLALRVEALREAGGFSERLGRVGGSLLSGEESAVVEELRRRGWRIWLEPAAVVDHAVAPERCVPRYYWRRLWWSGVTRARGGASAVLALRLAAAAPLRLLLFLATRDRVHLDRTAETAGYLAERLRLRRRPR